VDWQFIFSWFKIVILDLMLAGDNAVVIAMAVRTLPFRQQRIGIFLGALGAVIVRIILTFAAAELLQVSAVQLVGGLLLIWIAFKLLRQDNGGESKIHHGTTLVGAVRIIIVPDLIAGAAFIAALMSRCGWIVYVGAGILGEVAGKMILEDNFIEATLGEASKPLEWEIRIPSLPI
jgi:predicted tellurium resistance membrane protein TerC